MRRLLVGALAAAVLAFAPAAAASPGPHPPGSVDYPGGGSSQLSYEEATRYLATTPGLFPNYPEYCSSNFWWGSATFDAHQRFYLWGLGCGAHPYYIGSTGSVRLDYRSIRTYINAFRPVQRVYCQYTGLVESNYVNGTEQLYVIDFRITGCWGY